MHLESRFTRDFAKLFGRCCFSTICEFTCCLIRCVFLFFVYFPFFFSFSFPSFFRLFLDTTNTQTNNFLNASARFLVQHVIIVACVHCGRVTRFKIVFRPHCLLSLYVYVRLSVASTLKRCNSSQKREFHQKKKKKEKKRNTA